MRSLSFRVPTDLARRVDECTRRWRPQSGSEVYRRLIEEWVRLQDHPGIRFVDGPAGRRAALVGGPDVWEVIDAARDFDFDSAAILEAYPWLSAAQLEITKGYFDAYPDEIDALIRDNRDVAEELSEELELVVRERASSEPTPQRPPSDS